MMLKLKNLETETRIPSNSGHSMFAKISVHMCFVIMVVISTANVKAFNLNASFSFFERRRRRCRSTRKDVVGSLGAGIRRTTT